MNRIKTPKSVWRNPIHFLAFGFGAGASPWMPGTAGTAVGVVFYLILQLLPLSAYLAVTLLAFLIGIKLCQITARDMKVHDHPGIVWDEIVGYLITMIAIPATAGWIIFGFIIFRLFDIFKPWPITWIDKHVGGGIGIMLDDVLAGIYALAVLQTVAWFLLSYD